MNKRKPANFILRCLATTPDLIDQGEPVSLSWADVRRRRLRPSWPEGPARTLQMRTAPADIPFSGSFDPPAPDRDTTYHLEAFDAHGKKIDDRAVPITVKSRAPAIRLSVTPAVADTSKGLVKVALRWSASDTDSVQFAENVSLDTGTPSGTASVRETTDFVVTAVGPGGQSRDVATFFDYPGFLTGNTFTLATPAPLPPNSLRPTTSYCTRRSRSMTTTPRPSAPGRNRTSRWRVEDSGPRFRVRGS